MSPKETKTDGKYNINMGWVSFLPIMLLLGIVPLITRLEIVTVDMDTYKVFGKQQIVDFFSQNKSAVIMVIVSVMIFILFLAYDKTKFKLDKTMKIYYILAGVYLLFTLLSTVMSNYRSIAVWGIADRSEGMIMLGAYVIMMVYTIYLINQGGDYKYIIAPLCFLIVVMTVLGYYQYIGEDLLLGTEWGKNLIVPEKYAQLKGSLSSQYESGNIYGTLYHYNYMGSFGAMMVPLFLTLTLFFKGWKAKGACGVLTLASLFLLLGSTSRAGLIGLACSLVVLIIVCAKKLIKNYKWTLPVVLAGILVVIGLNSATKGAIFNRIPTLVNDAIGLFLPSGETFDYKDHLPVRDIRIEDNQIVIELQKETLKINPNDEEFAFTDAAGSPVSFTREDRYYKTTDTRFSAVVLDRQLIKDEEQGIEREFILVNYENKLVVVIDINTNEGIYFVNKNDLSKEPIQYPDAIGFKGKERLGSARGYIWSRSLPMMKETLLIGKGPDTYALEFPQNDIFGKWYAYKTPSMIVDKPHNLYLQIGINQGGIALLAFLGLVGLYVGQSLRAYSFKGYYENIEVAGISLFVSVVGYLGAGIFNDSIVSVAPIFWILLGAGIAINYLVLKERKRLQALKEHATINMKTRKHI